VEPDADLQITARRLVWGKWLNCGQTCLAPDYLLVKKGTKERLVAEMKAVLAEFYGEKPAESKDYGRIINEANFALA
jgi:aldehyde dehydrogenase (NAD+)